MSGKPFDHEFAALFAERSAPLCRYISRVSGDPAMAEDIVQECFVRLYRRASMPDDPPAWLVTVANNLLRDDRRGGARRQRLTLSPSSHLPLRGEAPPADAAVLAGERIESVRQALARLPLRDRQAVFVPYEGYSYLEIAGALH